MCVVSSVRMLESETVKFVLFGNRARAGHQHEDKGSFVLEFTGDTFAMDPGGSSSYYGAGCAETPFCQRHNMLVPTGTAQRAFPESPFSSDIRPTATGSLRTFTAEIDAGLCWKQYYKKWLRHVNSPSPRRSVIRDEYVLEQGTGGRLLWMTQLPVRSSDDGHRLALEGGRGRAIITAPPDTTVSTEEMPLRNEKITRIRISHDGTEGGVRWASN